MSRPFRWAILGTGNIARQFARDVVVLPDHQIAAVASRSIQRARAFCDALGLSRERALEGYEAVLEDRSIDAIYVSLPNSLHHEWTIRGLEAGRHVLCEKPLAMSLAEARQMFEAARRADRLLVEAFMYRCHPQTARLVEAVRSGAIGRLTHIRTSFAFHLRNTAGNIRFEKRLGGGALMDVGCYCISFSNLLAGARVSRAGAVSRTTTDSGEGAEAGVDVMTSGLLQYENGVQATFTCGMDAQSDNAAVISGTGGYITVPWPWKPTNATAGFTISRGIPPRQELAPGQKALAPAPAVVEAPSDVPLYALEARAFAAACRGEAEPFMTAAESLAVCETMQMLREAAGSSHSFRF